MPPSVERGEGREDAMKRIVTGLLAVAVLAGGFVGGGIEARAIEGPPPPPIFRSCRAMHHYQMNGHHRPFYHGVARTKAAADRQFAAGFRRPLVNANAYLANRKLDRDHDGTACEIKAR
jgi:Excalibur calcium-binding domain